MAATLFMDDCPTRRAWAKVNLDAPKDFFETCATAAECIGWLEWGEPDEDWDGPFWNTVYLDHDLGDEVYVDSSRPDCGMEVVRWVVENRPKVGKFVVHTMNTPAGHAMCRALKGAGYEVKYQSFYRLINGYAGVDSQ